MSDVSPPHDPDDPQGFLNGLEAAVLAVRLRCPHCQATNRVLPMSGSGWGVETFHEPGCPDNDDSLPTPERPDPGEHFS